MKKDRILTFIIVLSLLLTMSWAICVGMFWLFALCFSIKFSLKTATGVWLVLLLVKWAFDIGRKSDDR